MKAINTSTFDFPRIITKNLFYVDKTAVVAKLVSPECGEYFLSRPRRFGKSLLVSTLKAIFQGRRELFKGLAIDKMDYDWKAYPVIHLDFANCNINTADELEGFLQGELDNLSLAHKISLRGPSLSKRFENLINDLAAKVEAEAKAEAEAKGEKGEVKPGQVVVLVDEYDKPILGNITNTEHRDAILRVLKGFYSCVKKCEGRIRFAFITGVSKFSHVSLFSDLNNLTDITLNADYADLLGFTEAEIRSNFADRIPLAAEANGCQPEELMRRLLKWYDGYRFSKAETHVCNPVSVSKFFNEGYEFRNYWIDTGTPTFLLKLGMEENYDYEAALDEYYDEDIFSAYEMDSLDLTGLLWQTGYLTVKDVRQDEFGVRYRLGFPDMEVHKTFMANILQHYANMRKGRATILVEDFCKAIMANDLNGFMTRFQAFLAGIDYSLKLPHEKYYQTIFFVVFRLMGTFIEAESRTNEGRIDAYVRTPKTVYIFEFKLNKTAQTAIDQIVDRHYVEKFMGSGLSIVCVGANFNSEKGRLDSWKQLTVNG